MKPVQQPYREVFRHTHALQIEGESVRVPSVEMAVAMKFSAMASLYRSAENKHQDAHDFILMVKGNPDLDEKEMSRLASLIYPDAGKNLLELVRKARAGETLIL